MLERIGLRVLRIASFVVLPLAWSGCQGMVGAPPADITSINHIVFMVQENRSFDQYFGNLNAYRATLGLPQDVDALPPVKVDSLPQSPACDANTGICSNPSYDPSTGTINRSAPLPVFNLTQGPPGTTGQGTVCIVNTSPSWDEAHVDWNFSDPAGSTPTLDGFVFSAARYAIDNNTAGTLGTRAMGYYDDTVLNYYYFMASNFATSDRWFSPIPTRTQPNRIYLLGASSFGYTYPPSCSTPGFTGFTEPNIFQRLQNAGITWKVYISGDPVTTPSCVEFPTNYTKMYFPAFYNAFSNHFVPVSEYFSDLQNGSLPQVAMIEPGSSCGLDEHPDENPQTGALYVSTLINALMQSSSWKDSVFILTFDEAGGMFDHVPPQPAALPDNIAPLDLDLCPSGSNHVQGTFDRTGYRVPLIVVSPFTKKNYVSHTVADYTAVSKFIETRFNLAPLTQRDASQPDMTEFFNFANPPWVTPPSPPAQRTDGACNFNVPE